MPRSVLNLLKIKNKSVFKGYLLIGIINTVFAYFSGILIFNFFYPVLEIQKISILTSIFNITFSFLNYKLFLFKNFRNYISEYFKYLISNVLIILFSILTLYIFIEILNFSIYFAQLLIISLAVLFSYFVNLNYIFKK